MCFGFHVWWKGTVAPFLRRHRSARSSVIPTLRRVNVDPMAFYTHTHANHFILFLPLLIASVDWTNDLFAMLFRYNTAAKRETTSRLHSSNCIGCVCSVRRRSSLVPYHHPHSWCTSRRRMDSQSHFRKLGSHSNNEKWSLASFSVSN